MVTSAVDKPRRAFLWVAAHARKVSVCLFISTIDIYLSGLLARRQNAWSQDGGNMRVMANGVNR